MSTTTAPPYPLTWDLDSLLPHPESAEFRQTLKAFREDLQRIAERSDSLPAIDGALRQIDEWVTFLWEWEAVRSRASELNSFAGCHAAADAANKEFQRLEGVLSSLQPLLERISTNLEFALKDADEETFDRFVQADDWLAEIAFFLQDRRRNAELRLPKEQELLAADLSVDGIHAWGRLYDRLSGELRIQVMERGEIVEKSPGQVTLDSPQRAVRENNFFAADKAFSTIADTCADALNHISGTRLTLYRRLGLRDHLEVPLRYNRMKRETLQTMWSAIHERKEVLLQYLNKKAELLGVERLSWYDLQAPLPQANATQSDELSYDQACERVMRTFNGFSPEFGDFAQMALQNQWVEAENRSGKRQGGFCTGFPTMKESRIFMTFTNTPDSMFTLAHELGHAYHSWVLRDRPLFLRQYPMNLAETASTFAEAVLGEEQLKQSESSAEQLSILDGMLADAAAFLMNIHTRFIFEDAFHRERLDGELSAARFSELMLAAQQKAYCNALAEDGWNPNFWISKLHFYISSYPFYNFPYTFGYLLSLGLCGLAKERGEEFPDQYRDFLIATGCREAEEAVQTTLGDDLTQPDFWHKCLDVVDQRVEQFLQRVD